MHVIAKGPLNAFAEKHPESRSRLRAWLKIMKRARYKSPHEVRQDFAEASLLGDELTVFNIGDCRLVAFMVYRAGLVFVDGVYTHEEYDRRVRAGLLGKSF